MPRNGLTVINGVFWGCCSRQNRNRSSIAPTRPPSALCTEKAEAEERFWGSMLLATSVFGHYSIRIRDSTLGIRVSQHPNLGSDQMC